MQLPEHSWFRNHKKCGVIDLLLIFSADEEMKEFESFQRFLHQPKMKDTGSKDAPSKSTADT